MAVLSFPSTEGLPKSADGSEPILGASVGLNRILLMFKDRAQRDRHPQWQAYLLNAATITRNIFTPNISLKEARAAFLLECETFTTYLEAYLSRFHISASYPIVVYFPQYDHLPEDLRRHPTGRELEIWQLYEQLKKLFPLQSQTSQSHLTTRWTMHVGSHKYPHQELTDWLQAYALQAQTSYRWGESVAMISHCPLDFHIYKKIPKIALIESYTGLIKQKDQFGSKLEKTVSVPFNHITHRALGDPYQVLPLAQRKMRQELLQRAQHRQWMTRTPDTILSDVTSICHVSVADINKLKV